MKERESRKTRALSLFSCAFASFVFQTPLHNFDFLFRQPVQFIHERVDLLVRHVNFALAALARGVALGGLLLLCLLYTSPSPRDS